VRKPAFGVVVAGFVSLCAVLTFVEQNDADDAPRAGFALSNRSVADKPLQPDAAMQEQRPLNGNVDSETTISPAAAAVPAVAVESTPLILPTVFADSDSHTSQVRGESTHSPREATAFATTASVGVSDPVPIGSVIMTDDTAVDVPEGAPLPVAVLVSARLAETNPQFSRGQQEGIDRVATEFTKDIANGSSEEQPGSSASEATATRDLRHWHTATARANELTRALLGDELYNRELIREHQLKH